MIKSLKIYEKEEPEKEYQTFLTQLNSPRHDRIIQRWMLVLITARTEPADKNTQAFLTSTEKKHQKKLLFKLLKALLDSNSPHLIEHLFDSLKVIFNSDHECLDFNETDIAFFEHIKQLVVEQRKGVKHMINLNIMYLHLYHPRNPENFLKQYNEIIKLIPDFLNKYPLERFSILEKIINKVLLLYKHPSQCFNYFNLLKVQDNDILLLQSSLSMLHDYNITLLDDMLFQIAKVQIFYTQYARQTDELYDKITNLNSFISVIQTFDCSPSDIFTISKKLILLNINYSFEEKIHELDLLLRITSFIKFLTMMYPLLERIKDSKKIKILQVFLERCFEKFSHYVNLPGYNSTLIQKYQEWFKSASN